MSHSKMLAARRRKQKIRKILLRETKLAKKQAGQEPKPAAAAKAGSG